MQNTITAILLKTDFPLPNKAARQHISLLNFLHNYIRRINTEWVNFQKLLQIVGEYSGRMPQQTNNKYKKRCKWCYVDTVDRLNSFSN